jgi:serine/threonine protein kinase
MPEIPEESPDYLKKIIQDCWNKDPNKRPTIEEIEKYFKENKKFEENLNVFNLKKELNEKDTLELAKLHEKINILIPNFTKFDISNYKIIKQIGKGSFSNVFKAMLKKEFIETKIEEKKKNKIKGENDEEFISKKENTSNKEDIIPENEKFEKKFFAIKLLSTVFSEAIFENENFKRCVKEINIQLKLNKEKNICKVYGYTIFKNHLNCSKIALFLEYIDGENLYSFLEVENFFLKFIFNF